MGLEEKEVLGTEQKTVQCILAVEKQIREGKLNSIKSYVGCLCSERIIYSYLGFKLIFQNCLI